MSACVRHIMFTIRIFSRAASLLMSIYEFILIIQSIDFLYDNSRFCTRKCKLIRCADTRSPAVPTSVPVPASSSFATQYFPSSALASPGSSQTTGGSGLAAGASQSALSALSPAPELLPGLVAVPGPVAAAGFAPVPVGVGVGLTVEQQLQQQQQQQLVTEVPLLNMFAAYLSPGAPAPAAQQLMPQALSIDLAAAAAALQLPVPLAPLDMSRPHELQTCVFFSSVSSVSRFSAVQYIVLVLHCTVQYFVQSAYPN